MATVKALPIIGLLSAVLLLLTQLLVEVRRISLGDALDGASIIADRDC